MHDTKAKVLIVDDEPSIRSSLAHMLAEIGYRVLSAADGFSALHEIRQDIPDILLSDLNMPDMSGFELLSVVRRRFPAILAIAMSGAFSGDEVPSGVAADAFYQKGSSLGSLLRIMESLPRPERMAVNHAATAACIWVQKNWHDLAEEPSVTIRCPECLRTFPQAVGEPDGLMRETDCPYCHSSIQYAIAQPVDSAAAQAYPRPPREAKPDCLPQHYY